MRTLPAGSLTSHEPFIGLRLSVIGRVDRIGHLVQSGRSVGVLESAGRDVKRLDAQDRVGGPTDLSVSEPYGTADAATALLHVPDAAARETATARVPTCLWADQSILAVLRVPA